MAGGLEFECGRRQATGRRGRGEAELEGGWRTERRRRRPGEAYALSEPRSRERKPLNGCLTRGSGRLTNRRGRLTRGCASPIGGPNGGVPYERVAQGREFWGMGGSGGARRFDLVYNCGQRRPLRWSIRTTSPSPAAVRAGRTRHSGDVHGEAQSEGRVARHGCGEKGDSQEELPPTGDQPYRSGVYPYARVLRACRVSSDTRWSVAAQAPFLLRRRQQRWKGQGAQSRDQVAQERIEEVESQPG
jgi:hypothetical protein